MSVPALSLIGWSGAGKTTLLCALLPELASRGVRTAVVKHSAHPHPLDKRGSDTDLLARAGAAPVGLMTPQGLSLQLPAAGLDLPALLSRVRPELDLLLVEGWKDGPLPKIERWQEALGPRLSAERNDVLALVTDDEAPPGSRVFRTTEVAGLAVFLARWAKDAAETQR